MGSTGHFTVSLRRTEAGDLDALHAQELDAVSNARSGFKARGRAEFMARWARILADTDGTDTGVVPRVILAGGVLAGSVNIAPDQGRDALGFRVAREHWGRGIATRAVGLLLAEVTRRPLHATTAGHNGASIRVLEKHGFVEVARGATPETARAVARETVAWVLR
jgi:RimJ/RimL family protein N-acetyltransferase